MRQIFKWLGAIGSQAANIATLLGVTGAVAMSAVLATLAAWSDRLYAAVHLQAVQTWAAVFLFSLWTYIGLYIIATKRKPVLTKRLHDIDYGLAIASVFFVFNKNRDFCLQYGVNLQNNSGEAIRYKFSKFDVTLVSRRADLDKTAPTENVVTFGNNRSFFAKSYPKSEIESFFGKEVTGTIEVVLEYGPVNGIFTRLLTQECAISMDFTDIDAVKWNERIIVYKESSI